MKSKTAFDITITEHLSTHRKLKTLYETIRKDSRWAGIGDYPLLHMLCLSVKTQGVTVSTKEILETIHKCLGKSFARTTENSELVKQLI